MKRSLSVVLGGSLVLALLGGAPLAASAQEDSEAAAPDSEAAVPVRPAAATLDELLERVRQGWNAERAENRRRESALRTYRRPTAGIRRGRSGSI